MDSISSESEDLDLHQQSRPYIPWSFVSWWNGLEGQDLPFLFPPSVFLEDQGGVPLTPPPPTPREEEEDEQATRNLLKVKRNHSSGPMSLEHKQRRRREACRFSRRKIRYVPKKAPRKTFRYYPPVALALPV